MHNFIIKFFELFLLINDKFFAPADSLIEKLPLDLWVKDAIADSIHMVPFLFIIFLVIEFIEFYYSNKMNDIVKGSKKSGPLLGSIVASVPQCGFSVIASTLYTKRLITRGTLLAVYLSTSDEAIPVLLTEPGHLNLIVQILAVKIFIAVIAGYLIDFITGRTLHQGSQNDEIVDAGCCNHNVSKPKKIDLLLHPLIHTLNVFLFILLVTLLINYAVELSGGEEHLGSYFLSNSFLQPVVTAIFGLIPNCAVSIAITLMYIKGAIGFGSAVAGLLSGAGLGLLVLFKKNGDLKDTLKILGMLLVISIISGIFIQYLYN